MIRKTKQPLGEQPPRSTADTELVSEVLGEETAGEMEELTGTSSVKNKDEKQTPGLTLSRDEQAAAREAEKNPGDERRAEYYTWAFYYDLDEEWVDNTFIFNSDGTVIAEGDVDLRDSGIATLPSNLVEVRGNLNLYGNQIASPENFPRRVGGSLNLSNNPMTSLEGLPDAVGNDVYLNNNLDIASLEGLPKLIGGNLDLKNVSATSIPDGLDIGTIHLTHTQTELRADCNTKNYNVRINH